MTKKTFLSLVLGGAWGYTASNLWQHGILPGPAWVMLLVYVSIPAVILGFVIQRSNLE